MNARQLCLLVNMNRVLILVLTLAGLWMDGFSSADLLCSVALCVWLWLPHCARMEASLLHRARGKRAHDGAAGMTPFV